MSQLIEENHIEQTLESAGLYKALTDNSQGAKAYELNPYDVETISSQYATIDTTHQGTQSELSYDSLRQLASVPLISAIIQTRINQIAEFARPQPDRYDTGFIIRQRNKSEELDDRTREQIEYLQEWLLTCGIEEISGFQTFEAFIRQLVRDSLTYDQACFEIIYQNGRPVSFKAVDSATIRRTAPSAEERKSGRRDHTRAAYCQVIDGRVVAHFEAKEMAWGIRRPRSEMSARGYGFPELAEARQTAIDIMRTKAYNSANFTHGLHLSGILAIKSKMSPALFRAFRREFYAMLQGPNGAKKTPIIQLDPESKEDVSSVSLSNSNREMEFSQWLNFLIKEVCALYQIDPAELGYLFGNEGQTNSLAASGPNERILHSREKGLRPMLRALETWLNRWLIQPIAPHLELSFVGIESDSEERRIKATKEKVSSFLTINEARAAFDLEPLDGGDIVLNQVYVTATMGRDGAEGQIDGDDLDQPDPSAGLNQFFGKSSETLEIDEPF